MNWVDIAVLTVVAFSGMLGFLRGMVREVFGLAAWAGALFAAVWFFPQMQGLARRSIANPDIADPVAFGSIFLLVVIVLSLIARALSTIVRSSGLGGLDRTLGLVFGLLRGAGIVVAAYIIGAAIDPPDQWPPQVLEARTLPSIYLGANWVAQRVPESYRPTVPVPPVGPPAQAADLLHANPVGRALGAPPARP